MIASTPAALTAAAGLVVAVAGAGTVAACSGDEEKPPPTEDGASIDLAACNACAERTCPDAAEACRELPGCLESIPCYLACPPGDLQCAVACSEGNADRVAAASGYWACAAQCPACSSNTVGENPGVGGIPNVAVGGASSSDGGEAEDPEGTAGAPGQGGASATGGTSSPAGAPSSGGRSETGGISETGGQASGGHTGGTAGTGGVQPTGGMEPTGGTGPVGGGSTGGSLLEGIPGVIPLSFEGDWADPEAGQNGALGISGVLYAYGDDCAELLWDPTTRCASGVLCDPGPDYENWGVAIGFDFVNTGELGTPPNAKLPWDASAVGAFGVAWAIRGTAPALQVWVLNMAPEWDGACTAENCNIEGPPDGWPYAANVDYLEFAYMEKDDWGGSGIDYVFDERNISALQFKLPAVYTGSVAFDFCIDELGIIRL